jgi:hypothetical protein
VYFDNLYKCYAVFEEEERRSRTEVYHGDDSIGKRALQRVLLRKQLDAMRTELREIMVYQSPPELGALWTEVEAMMEVVGKEQAVLIAEEMQRDRAAYIARRRRINHIKCEAWKYGLTVFFVCFISFMAWCVVQVRMEMRPELGSCLIPKGGWLYEHYNNLKWVDCEIRQDSVK